MLPQVRLQRAAGVPLHQQLGEELRRMILSERLPPGSRLPATRQAAAELGVSRNVVVLAYEQLRVEGYLKSAVGVGTWVPYSLGKHLLRPSKDAASEAAVPVEETPGVSNRGRRLSRPRLGAPASRPTYPFRPAGIAADLFPVRVWSRISTRLWRTRTIEMVQYGEVQGYRPLREALAEHLTRFRGVQVTPERILITAGSQQTLDLIVRMLLDPDDLAALEDPGYAGAVAALEAGGARLLPVPVDGDGLDLGRLGPESDGVRLLYTTPSHQYPLGVTMSLERRLAVLDWAHQARSWVIEDDYDSEFRFESRPLPALQGLGRGDRVVYVGTFSKVLAPALRLAFIVLPESLVEPFVNARRLIDQHPPIHLQATLARFIADGHLERHLARMRAVYGERRAYLLEALRTTLADYLDVVPGDGGLHVATRLAPGIDDVEVARRAFARGIDPQPLSVAFRDRNAARSGLILGFGGFGPERLGVAVEVLRGCLEEVRGKR